MLRFFKRENCERLDQRMQAYGIVRFLTSHTALAFFYGVFLFLYELRYLRQAVPAIHPVLIAWAGALAVYDIVVRRIWEKLPNRSFLLLFCLAAGITAITTIETGAVSNIKGWIFVVLPLVAFYPLCLLEPEEKRKKALIKAMLGAAIVIFAASALAVVMYLQRFSQEVAYMGEIWTLGIRHYIPGDETTAVLLYGIYTDTNHAAAYAVAFAAYSVVLFLSCLKGLFHRHWQNVLGAVFAGLNFFVQVCYFPLANSRGGWLCLLAAVVLCTFAWGYHKIRVSGNGRRIAAAVLSAVLVTGTLYGSLIGLRSGLSDLSMMITYGISSGGNTSATTPATGPSSTGPSSTVPPTIPGDSFDKTDNGSGSGRLNIWKEGLGLFAKRPIFGTGPGNNAYYADKYNVGILLAEGDALHNSFLDLLVDYGIVGFISLTGFWGACLWAVLRAIWSRGKTLGMDFYLNVFTVLFVAGISVFLSCTFINTTAMYYLMLLPCSYLMAVCGITQRRKNERE